MLHRYIFFLLAFLAIFTFNTHILDAVFQEEAAFVSWNVVLSNILEVNRLSRICLCKRFNSPAEGRDLVSGEKET